MNILHYDQVKQLATIDLTKDEYDAALMNVAFAQNAVIGVSDGVSRALNAVQRRLHGFFIGNFADDGRTGQVPAHMVANLAVLASAKMGALPTVGWIDLIQVHDDVPAVPEANGLRPGTACYFTVNGEPHVHSGTVLEIVEGSAGSPDLAIVLDGASGQQIHKFMPNLYASYGDAAAAVIGQGAIR